MADVQTAPLSGTPVPAEEPVQPTQPEISCETLYIQNLNEKIKIDGMESYDHSYEPKISHLSQC